METSQPIKSDPELLSQASEGDIIAFQALFEPHYRALKSYGYRLLANRSDAEDLAHDTFIKAFDKLKSFKQESSFKTWVFSIATRMAYDKLSQRKRWVADTKQQAKQLCLNTPELVTFVEQTARNSPDESFEIRDHIDHCFTCMGKTLMIEKQIALILKDIYHFSVKEIASIMTVSTDVAKHLLADARATMLDIFDNRCSLINKNGACHQCSELNGWFNPKQDQVAALLKLKLVRLASKYDREKLYDLRTELIRAVQPLDHPRAELQDALMRCDRIVNGEEVLPYH